MEEDSGASNSKPISQVHRLKYARLDTHATNGGAKKVWDNLKDGVFSLLFIINKEGQAGSNTLNFFLEVSQFLQVLGLVMSPAVWDGSPIHDILTGTSIISFRDIAALLVENKLSTNWATIQYTAFAISALWVLGIGVAATWVAAVSGKGNAPTVIWPQRLLRVTARITGTALFIPLVNIFLSVRHCTDTNADVFSDNPFPGAINCATAGYGTLIGFAFLLIFVHCLMSFLVISISFNVIEGKIHCRADIIRLFAQLILTISMAFQGNFVAAGDSAIRMLQAIIIISVLVSMFSTFSMPPFTVHNWNRLFAAFDGALLWAALITAFRHAIGSHNALAVVLLIGGCIPSSFLAVSAIDQRVKELDSTPISEIRLFVPLLIELKARRLHSRLTSLRTGTHGYTSWNMSSTSLGGFQGGVFGAVEELYRKALILHPTSAYMHVFAAAYYHRHGSGVHRRKELALLARAERLDRAPDVGFLIQQRRKQMEDLQHQLTSEDSLFSSELSLGVDSGPIGVMSRLAFDKAIGDATRGSLRTREAILNLWTLLLPTTPDLDKLHLACVEFVDSMRLSLAAFEAALRVSPRDAFVLRTFSGFLSDTGDYPRARELSALADRLEGAAQRTSHARPVSLLLLSPSTTGYLDPPDNATCIVSLVIDTNSRLPFISAITPALTRLLGYQAADVVGKPLPVLFARPTNVLVLNMLREIVEIMLTGGPQERGQGASKLARAPITALLASRNGTCVPCLWQLHGGSDQLVALFQPCISRDEGVVVFTLVLRERWEELTEDEFVSHNNIVDAHRNTRINALATSSPTNEFGMMDHSALDDKRNRQMIIYDQARNEFVDDRTQNSSRDSLLDSHSRSSHYSSQSDVPHTQQNSSLHPYQGRGLVGSGSFDSLEQVETQSSHSNSFTPLDGAAPDNLLNPDLHRQLRHLHELQELEGRDITTNSNKNNTVKKPLQYLNPQYDLQSNVFRGSHAHDQSAQNLTEALQRARSTTAASAAIAALAPASIELDISGASQSSPSSQLSSPLAVNRAEGTNHPHLQSGDSNSSGINVIRVYEGHEVDAVNPSSSREEPGLLTDRSSLSHIHAPVEQYEIGENSFSSESSSNEYSNSLTPLPTVVDTHGNILSSISEHAQVSGNQTDSYPNSEYNDVMNSNHNHVVPIKSALKKTNYQPPPHASSTVDPFADAQSVLPSHSFTNNVRKGFGVSEIKTSNDIMSPSASSAYGLNEPAGQLVAVPTLSCHATAADAISMHLLHSKPSDFSRNAQATLDPRMTTNSKFMVAQQALHAAGAIPEQNVVPQPNDISEAFPGLSDACIAAVAEAMLIADEASKHNRLDAVKVAMNGLGAGGASTSAGIAMGTIPEEERNWAGTVHGSSAGVGLGGGIGGGGGMGGLVGGHGSSPGNKDDYFLQVENEENEEIFNTSASMGKRQHLTAVMSRGTWGSVHTLSVPLHFSLLNKRSQTVFVESKLQCVRLPQPTRPSDHESQRLLGIAAASNQYEGALSAISPDALPVVAVATGSETFFVLHWKKIKHSNLPPSLAAAAHMHAQSNASSVINNGNPLNGMTGNTRGTIGTNLGAIANANSLSRTSGSASNLLTPIPVNPVMNPTTSTVAAASLTQNGSSNSILSLAPSNPPRRPPQMSPLHTITSSAQLVPSSQALPHLMSQNSMVNPLGPQQGKNLAVSVAPSGMSILRRPSKVKLSSLGSFATPRNSMTGQLVITPGGKNSIFNSVQPQAVFSQNIILPKRGSDGAEDIDGRRRSIIEGRSHSVANPAVSRTGSSSQLSGAQVSQNTTYVYNYSSNTIANMSANVPSRRAASSEQHRHASSSRMDEEDSPRVAVSLPSTGRREREKDRDESDREDKGHRVQRKPSQRSTRSDSRSSDTASYTSRGSSTYGGGSVKRQLNLLRRLLSLEQVGADSALLLLRRAYQYMVLLVLVVLFSMHFSVVSYINKINRTSAMIEGLSEIRVLSATVVLDLQTLAFAGSGHVPLHLPWNPNPYIHDDSEIIEDPLLVSVSSTPTISPSPTVSAGSQNGPTTLTPTPSPLGTATPYALFRNDFNSIRHELDILKQKQAHLQALFLLEDLDLAAPPDAYVNPIQGASVTPSPRPSPSTLPGTTISTPFPSYMEAPYNPVHPVTLALTHIQLVLDVLRPLILDVISTASETVSADLYGRLFSEARTLTIVDLSAVSGDAAGAQCPEGSQKAAYKTTSGYFAGNVDYRRLQLVDTDFDGNASSPYGNLDDPFAEDVLFLEKYASIDGVKNGVITEDIEDIYNNPIVNSFSRDKARTFSRPVSSLHSTLSADEWSRYSQGDRRSLQNGGQTVASKLDTMVPPLLLPVQRNVTLSTGLLQMVRVLSNAIEESVAFWTLVVESDTTFHHPNGPLPSMSPTPSVTQSPSPNGARRLYSTSHSSYSTSSSTVASTASGGRRLSNFVNPELHPAGISADSANVAWLLINAEFIDAAISAALLKMQDHSASSYRSSKWVTPIAVVACCVVLDILLLATILPTLSAFEGDKDKILRAFLLIPQRMITALRNKAEQHLLKDIKFLHGNETDSDSDSDAGSDFSDIGTPQARPEPLKKHVQTVVNEEYKKEKEKNALMFGEHVNRFERDHIQDRGSQRSRVDNGGNHAYNGMQHSDAHNAHSQSGFTGLRESHSISTVNEHNSRFTSSESNSNSGNNLNGQRLRLMEYHNAPDHAMYSDIHNNSYNSGHGLGPLDHPFAALSSGGNVGEKSLSRTQNHDQSSNNVLSPDSDSISSPVHPSNGSIFSPIPHSNSSYALKKGTSDIAVRSSAEDLLFGSVEDPSNASAEGKHPPMFPPLTNTVSASNATPSANSEPSGANPPVVSSSNFLANFGNNKVHPAPVSRAMAPPGLPRIAAPRTGSSTSQQLTKGSSVSATPGVEDDEVVNDSKHIRSEKHERERHKSASGLSSPTVTLSSSSKDSRDGKDGVTRPYTKNTRLYIRLVLKFAAPILAAIFFIGALYGWTTIVLNAVSYAPLHSRNSFEPQVSMLKMLESLRYLAVGGSPAMLVASAMTSSGRSGIDFSTYFQNTNSPGVNFPFTIIQPDGTLSGDTSTGSAYSLSDKRALNYWKLDVPVDPEKRSQMYQRIVDQNGAFIEVKKDPNAHAYFNASTLPLSNAYRYCQSPSQSLSFESLAMAHEFALMKPQWVQTLAPQLYSPLVLPIEGETYRSDLAFYRQLSLYLNVTFLFNSPPITARLLEAAELSEAVYEGITLLKHSPNNQHLLATRSIQRVCAPYGLPGEASLPRITEFLLVDKSPDSIALTGRSDNFGSPFYLSKLKERVRNHKYLHGVNACVDNPHQGFEHLQHCHSFSSDIMGRGLHLAGLSALEAAVDVMSTLPRGHFAPYVAARVAGGACTGSGNFSKPECAFFASSDFWTLDSLVRSHMARAYRYSHMLHEETLNSVISLYKIINIIILGTLFGVMFLFYVLVYSPAIDRVSREVLATARVLLLLPPETIRTQHVQAIITGVLKSLRGRV